MRRQQVLGDGEHVGPIRHPVLPAYDSYIGEFLADGGGESRFSIREEALPGI